MIPPPPPLNALHLMVVFICTSVAAWRRCQISTGHLVNLTTTDVEKFQYGGMLVNYLWGAPLESLVILYFGLDLVGVSFLAGFAALALMVPMQV